MKSDSLSAWAQIAATVAVVIGLALVVLEIRQTKELVSAQLLSEFFSLSGQTFGTVAGEDSAEVLAKACRNPGDLTDDELIIVEEYLLHQWMRAEHLRLMAQEGNLNFPWEIVSASTIRHTFRIKHGVWYARHVAPDQFPAIAATIDVSETTDASCAGFYEAFRSGQPPPKQ